ncbi:hypothetical protein BJY52DRAFT_900045 [Lactarius psammicola]|nr:hypothetical protein BJY52DRAFT_900045 [Lactarius psammicola]
MRASFVSGPRCFVPLTPHRASHAVPFLTSCKVRKAAGRAVVRSRTPASVIVVADQNHRAGAEPAEAHMIVLSVMREIRVRVSASACAAAPGPAIPAYKAVRRNRCRVFPGRVAPISHHALVLLPGTTSHHASVSLLTPTSNNQSSGFDFIDRADPVGRAETFSMSTSSVVSPSLYDKSWSGV